jgi:LysM repeat protein
VQAGDSGFGIALQFDTTLEALAAANGLSVDDLTNLQIGQELLIPAS